MGGVSVGNQPLILAQTSKLKIAPILPWLINIFVISTNLLVRFPNPLATWQLGILTTHLLKRNRDLLSALDLKVEHGGSTFTGVRSNQT